MYNKLMYELSAHGVSYAQLLSQIYCEFIYRWKLRTSLWVSMEHQNRRFTRLSTDMDRQFIAASNTILSTHELHTNLL